MRVPDDVRAFLDGVTPATRKRDAEVLLDLMGDITGEAPELHGTMVGFGTYHYKYDSGREGDAAAASFAPRKGAMTVYLMDGVAAHASDLDRLGPHTSGVGCLYIKDLERVDLGVLERIVRRSYATLTSGTFGSRAREGTED
jgi:hypothetical protein